ncbi:MAG: hypothetical protein IKQ22_00920 [Clostridia bacterium]|nr:hypothetical protein [Clostridia bacterium]
MSSKTKRMTDKLSDPVKAVASKTAVYRIDFEMITADDVAAHKSATVEVSGIPVELKREEYNNLAMHTAQTIFCNVLNSRMFLETYPEGKTAKDGVLPDFINLYTTVARISIKNVEWLEEKY